MQSILHWTQNIVDVFIVIIAIVIIVRTFVYKQEKDFDFDTALLKQRKIASIGIIIWFVQKILVVICNFFNL